MNIPKECLSAISKNDEEADVGNSRTLSCLQPTICKVCGSKGASMHKIKNIYGKKQWFPLCDKCLK